MADNTQAIQRATQYIDSSIRVEEKSQAATKPLLLQPAAAKKVHNGEKTTPQPTVDVFILAYYDLLKTTNTISRGALLQAKELQANSRAQQRLDNMAARLNLYNVPKLILKHECHKIKKKEYTDPFTHSGQVVYYKTVKKIRITIRVNGGAVDQAEAKNQLVISERQTISGKLAVLGELAELKDTNINTLVEDSQQSAMEASGLLTMLEDLTFKANLRKPPQ